MNLITHSALRITINGDVYDVRSSDLKSKIIFNTSSQIKNIVKTMSFNNPLIEKNIQIFMPEQVLKMFLQSNEGKGLSKVKWF